MTPIVKYLESDILPEDHNESRRIKKQAARYCLYQGKLYRRSFSGPYLRCQSPREATRILEELHDGECGSHSSGRSPVLKARRAEYYCPTMAGDANNQAKKCSQCQRHAPVSKLPPENLKYVSSLWPFGKWGLYIVGKFPMAAGQKVLLIVVTDYFSKWVEAEALSSITDCQIKKFFWTDINTRFGISAQDHHRQWTSVHQLQFQKISARTGA